MVSPRELLPGHRGSGCVGTGSATAEGAGPASQRKPLQAPLCRTTPVPGVRQCLCPNDSVLEQQAACGVCLQGLPPEWEKILQIPPYPRGNTGCHSVGVSHGNSGQSRQRAGETCETAKNVGVEETGPRRPHFIVTEKNSASGGGDRWDCIILYEIIFAINWIIANFQQKIRYIVFFQFFCKSN